MTIKVTISTDDEYVWLNCPADPALRERALMLGGRWDGESRWKFDILDEQRVRDLARDLFGDADDNTTQYVTIRIDIAKWGSVPEVRVAGRLIARRPGRDQIVKLGEKVIVVEGGFAERGGSMRYPLIDAKPGTILEARRVPAGHRDLADPDITIMDNTLDHDTLRAERDRLRTRLAEIAALLRSD